jgi:hypothetical protein
MLLCRILWTRQRVVILNPNLFKLKAIDCFLVYDVCHVIPQPLAPTQVVYGST